MLNELNLGSLCQLKRVAVHRLTMKSSNTLLEKTERQISNCVECYNIAKKQRKHGNFEGTFYACAILTKTKQKWIQTEFSRKYNSPV